MKDTALTTAIQEFERLKEAATSLRDKIYLDAVIAVLVGYLPQEREDMEKAYADGFNKVWGDGKAVQIHEHEYIDRAGIPIEKEYFDITFSQYKTNSNG